MLDLISSNPVNTGSGVCRRFAPGFLCAFVILAAVPLLTGCGKKPGHVDSPPGASGSFPRTYPDPSTDPQP